MVIIIRYLTQERILERIQLFMVNNLDYTHKILHILFMGILVGQREQHQVIPIIEQPHQNGRENVWFIIGAKLLLYEWLKSA